MSQTITRDIQKRVLINQDKHMQLAQKNKSLQPFQLDLWGMLVSNSFSNSIEFYQTLPDVFAGKQDKLRNPDGSLPVLTRKGNYAGQTYQLDISPANISVSKPGIQRKVKKAFYKTVIAEFVEYALQKLSVSEGFFISHDDVQTEQFGLITTYYKIREELKKRGKHYSYEQIREAISILAGLRYELSGDICKQYGLDSFFSPIDLIIKNDKKNNQHSVLYITFNKLVSKKVLALDWREYNYQEFMKVKTSFGRNLFMRLSYRFKNVDAVNGYHFLLSTLIKDGLLPDDIITTNIKKIEDGLVDCQYLIDSFQAEKIYHINPKTNRRALIDYKVTTFPTSSFQYEQYRFNVQNKHIKNYRMTPEGQPVIKPLRDQYPTSYDYQRYLKDLEVYESAKL